MEFAGEQVSLSLSISLQGHKKSLEATPHQWWETHVVAEDMGATELELEIAQDIRGLVHESNYEVPADTPKMRIGDQVVLTHGEHSEIMKDYEGPSILEHLLSTQSKQMRIYGGAVRSGKTLHTLISAAQNNGQIVVSNTAEAERLDAQAKQMGLSIKNPITVADWAMRNLGDQQAQKGGD